jgi:DNA-directed RNA polymerase sigma subunit (sigma70/sigma32)
MDFVEEYKKRRSSIRLKPRYLDIFEFRYGLVDGKKHTLEETGKKFSISGTRVMQITARVQYEIENIVNGRVG